MLCLDTRVRPDGSMRRRYECPSCKRRSTTVEQEVPEVGRGNNLEFVAAYDVELMKAYMLESVTKAIKEFVPANKAKRPRRKSGA